MGTDASQEARPEPTPVMPPKAQKDTGRST